MSEAVAVLSDIHGNRWALEAVLDDMRRSGISRAVQLGDAVYGPLDPAGTADLLIDLDFQGVAGNQDRVIVDAAEKPSRPLQWVREQLAEDHLDWLRELPSTLVVEDMVLCHGTPTCDERYLLWDVESSGARSRSPDEIAESLRGVEQPIVLCGHDHVPQVVELSDGRMVVDPGSVGLPAYMDDEPLPHVMETGSPHARYAVLHRAGAGLAAEIRAVPYDWSAAAAAAQRNGRPDWAGWLASGLARGG
jgi:diadenosine tetraphosphatase ApaH/serine/threonine PP2A family protein phosphatase